jgi:hypothetical protein
MPFPFAFAWLYALHTVKHSTRYLVDWHLNPSRLMSEDTGVFKIFVGDHMLIVEPDTPGNRKRTPRAIYH